MGILGLSYKPDTGVVEESPGVALASTCGRAPRDQRLRSGRDRSRRSADSARNTRAAPRASCSRGPTVVVIATPWKEFADSAVARGPADGARRDRLLAHAGGRRYGDEIEIVRLGRPLEAGLALNT